MDLHRHSVFTGHPCHFGQHLRAEEFGLAGRKFAPERAVKQPLAFARRQIGGLRRGMAVIGGRGAMGAEESTAIGKRLQITAPRGGVFFGQVAQGGDVRCEILAIGIDNIVRTERRDDPPAPIGLYLLVMLEGIDGAFGRCQNLDVEALEQGTRTKSRRRQGVVDGVVIEVGRGRFQPHIEFEDRCEDVIEPEARWRAAKQPIVLGEQSPARAAIFLSATAGRGQA